MLSWGEQYLRGMFIQAMMYGVYLATFAHCLRWLIYQDEGWKLRPREGLNWPMLTATISIFILSTADLSLELRETIAIIAGERLIFFKHNIASVSMPCHYKAPSHYSSERDRVCYNSHCGCHSGTLHKLLVRPSWNLCLDSSLLGHLHWIVAYPGRTNHFVACLIHLHDPHYLLFCDGHYWYS